MFNRERGTKDAAADARRHLLFVGGNVGRLNAEPLAYTGKVGGDVTLEQAYEMARRCALNHLAADLAGVPEWLSVQPADVAADEEQVVDSHRADVVAGGRRRCRQ